MATLLWVVVALLPMVAGTGPEARAATPTIVLGRNRIGEFQGVRSDQFIAWQQNTRDRPRHYDVFARPLAGGERFKVNAPGTNGANGDIAGDMLVYQQFRGGDSDIRLFGLVDRDRGPPPPGVNTKQWEYWPSLSGDRLLFGRLDGSGLRTIFLIDIATGSSTSLAKTRSENAFLAPGQVNGDYAVWYRCTPDEVCHVVRYNIADNTKDTIPNPGGSQHSPSVTSDGTVYFAWSRRSCGSGARVMRYPPGGPATMLWRLPSGDDVGSTHVYVSPEGDATLYYDHFACGQPAVSDVWEIVEEGSIQLSVTVEGDGSGIVTSAPPGINCGPDCSEIYEAGTGVTLTAAPQGASAFAGWSGACTGTGTTCTLTMDGPKSVTATFTTKPVLSVEILGSGSGTVTSSPPGIDCGTDCNEPYDEGTSVTLTATPDATSTFAGWGGACSGTGLCTVLMDASKSVTATFTALPHELTVTVDGDGSVTSDSGGIDCPAVLCAASYPPGTMVTLTAALGATATMVEWGGDCAGTVGFVCSLTMDSGKSVSATFS